MTAVEWIIGAFLILFALAIIVVVLLQEGHEKNIGVVL